MMLNCIRFLLFFCVLQTSYSLSISPTRVDLNAREPVATLSLMNDGVEPLILQLHATKWTQKEGKNITTASDDMLITPQIFSLKPKESQLVRLGIEDLNLIASVDKAYRLIIQEVKPPVRTNTNGIRFVLNISVPVIINANSPRVDAIEWSFKKNKSSELSIQAENKGNKVIFINQMTILSTHDDFVIPTFSTFNYLLPGSKTIWKLYVANQLPIRKILATIDNNLVMHDFS